MVKRFEQGSEQSISPQGESILNKIMSRRGVLGYTAAVGASVVLVGCGESSASDSVSAEGSSRQASGESVEQSEGIAYEEPSDVFQSVVIPDLYEDRSWADPEQLFGLSYEEMCDIIAIPDTLEARDYENFTAIFGQRLELIANAGKGRSLRDVERAKKLNYISQDSDGNWSGSYPDYVRNELIRPALGILLSDTSHEDYIDTRQLLEDHFVHSGRAFFASVNGSRPELLHATPLTIETGFIEPLQPNISRDSLRLGIETSLPMPRGSGTVRSGDMVVNTSKGATGALDIGIKSINLNKISG